MAPVAIRSCLALACLLAVHTAEGHELEEEPAPQTPEVKPTAPPPTSVSTSLPTGVIVLGALALFFYFMPQITVQLERFLEFLQANRARMEGRAAAAQRVAESGRTKSKQGKKAK
eukprot:gb/GFBE01061613.1/.p1 GENE.gb/GFBE01061613.1/~~gb/GFBE01061613.1/.p1  ORF type:complete len:115 (+),score=15.44 gb/GFBE01061613.1/:1-345(+)